MTDADPMPGTIAACTHCRMMVVYMDGKWQHMLSRKIECDALPPIGWKAGQQ